MKRLFSQLFIHRWLTISFCSLLLCLFSPTIANAQNSNLETDLVKVRAIAKEATIWAYPMVENYQSIYNLAIDRTSENYQGPINQINNVSQVLTPNDTAIITPNSDTPYSYLIMDLRAEPLVVTMPAIDPDRYYSLQLVDLYTFDFDYLGTRVDENHGGNYLIAGPNWNEEKPEGIKRVIYSETDLVFSQFRTQLFSPDDIDNVINIQEQYKVKPLSKFLGTQLPKDPPEIDYPHINRDILNENFFKYMNFLLQFCPTHPSEVELRDKFKTIGIEPLAVFPPAGVSQEWLNEVASGQKDGTNAIDEVANQTKSSAGLFGTREELDNNYLNRAVAARVGIYGNSDAETFYAGYITDIEGDFFDSSEHNYVLQIQEDIPALAFWSVTMYDGETRFLIHNPLDRYLINSAMLPELKKNADDSITLYLQNKSPGKEKESNWLPAPDGKMFVVMRLYIPDTQVVEGNWEAPAMVTSD